MRSSFLRAGIPFGCLGAALLGVAMTLVIFIGSVMGDCDPGPGCHDHDGFIIARSLLLAAPVVLLVGFAITALAASADALLRDHMDGRARRALLSIVTVIAACLSFDPAFGLFSWLARSAGS